jgi:hypothetical protein
MSRHGNERFSSNFKRSSSNDAENLVERDAATSNKILTRRIAELETELEKWIEKSGRQDKEIQRLKARIARQMQEIEHLKARHETKLEQVRGERGDELQRMIQRIKRGIVAYGGDWDERPPKEKKKKPKVCIDLDWIKEMQILTELDLAKKY